MILITPTLPGGSEISGGRGAIPGTKVFAGNPVDAPRIIGCWPVLTF